jgi:hypothetical protein
MLRTGKGFGQVRSRIWCRLGGSPCTGQVKALDRLGVGSGADLVVVHAKDR